MREDAGEGFSGLADDATLKGGPTRRSPWRATGRPAEASDLRQLARLDQVNQHVPLVLLQDREVPGFTDAHLVALDGDFRAVDARWAERHLQAVHIRLLPFFGRLACSMCGHTTPPAFPARRQPFNK